MQCWWREGVAKIDNFDVKVDIQGRDCSRVGGEMTELWLPHRGVRAHDAAMGQDSGVGACSAVTDGDDMSEGEWQFWF